ncbi:MAG: hypothetical protein E4G94_03560 [ANME-2 cluster archaeon]|nr:MAG: hypothetical protein E4G94_03560 [ANME-2 cluster archaeon]
MYSDKHIQEIRNQAKKCMVELGPLDLKDPSNLYPIVAIASGELDRLRFTKSVTLITQELSLLSSPNLFPTIHLFGPENLGNFEIIQCHPLIRPHSGHGIDKFQDNKIQPHRRSHIDEITQINETYKEHIEYLKNIFKITNSLPTDDLINLCYDSVLNRKNASGSHNILNEEESLSDVVLTSICRNALRMMPNKRYKPNKFIQSNETGYLSRITNSYSDIECLKDGSFNNVTTFLAIYSLSVLEFPSTIDHVCLTLSTRYQHKIREYDRYIKSEYKSKSEYNDLRKLKPELPHIKQAIEIEKNVGDIKAKVYSIVKQSVENLKKDKLIVMQGKRIVPNVDTLVIKSNGKFKEINMPSAETIKERKSSITNFNKYLMKKKREWRAN